MISLVHLRNGGSRQYCNHRLQGRFQEDASLNQRPSSNSLLSWFLKFFPVTYIRTVLIPATNDHITGAPVEWPEFLRFIGMLFLMASMNTAGCDSCSWFQDT